MSTVQAPIPPKLGYCNGKSWGTLLNERAVGNPHGRDCIRKSELFRIIEKNLAEARTPLTLSGSRERVELPGRHHQLISGGPGLHNPSPTMIPFLPEKFASSKRDRTRARRVCRGFIEAWWQ